MYTKTSKSNFRGITKLEISDSHSNAHTPTGYLPEHFLPEFLDLVVWGHEHQCLIDPRYNPEKNFHVMQPGSSVATSLALPEAVPKQVAVLSITGRDFKVETIRLKTVRPFVMKEIVLSENKEAKKYAKKEDNRADITRVLIDIVEDLIEQAKAGWLDAQDEIDQDEELEIPKPLIRLRVEYSAPDGGNYDCENPQRFSNRFVGKVANVNDVIQFHRKKSGTVRKAHNGAELPEESVLAHMSIESVKVEKLVREFLTAQSLTILPQNSFGDAVSQFVDKDDKHAMEMFVTDSLTNQFKHLMNVDQYEEDEIQDVMDQYKSKLEELFAAGHLKKTRKAKLKPKPDNWDTELDGEWGDRPGALAHSDLDDKNEDEDEDETVLRSSKTTAARGRGKAAASRKAVTTTQKATASSKAGKGRKKVLERSEEEEDDKDVVMIDPSEEEDESQLFLKPEPPSRGSRKAASTKKSALAVKQTPPRVATTKQSTLNFSQPASQRSQVIAKGKSRTASEMSDEISDDDDAFAPAPATTRSTRSKR